jgi:AcrR family transcriptional regulator
MDHGLAELSLRPLAKALGVSPRVILYHFGSKEQLVTEVVEATRRAMAFPTGLPSDEAIRTYWQTRTQPEAKAYVRLFFEVLMLSLQSPDRPAYQSFLNDMERELIEPWQTIFLREGRPAEQARQDASLVAGTLRGLLIDYLVSDDLKRTTDAVERLVHHIAVEPAVGHDRALVQEARVGTTTSVRQRG